MCRQPQAQVNHIFFHIDALSVIGINMSVCVCVYVHICMCMCADKCGYSGAASAGRCDK